MRFSTFFPIFVAALAATGETRSIRPDICVLPLEQGFCRAGLLRYYYNAKEGKCREFTYGGCGGNKNIFMSEKECEEACDKRNMCSEVCPMIYEPVCGSDGKTYSNVCELEVTACKSGQEIMIKYEGKCSSDNRKSCAKPCPMIYKPVCGSDGKTYSNMCVMDVKACLKQEYISIEYDGKCEEEKLQDE